jgi:hypothetical protein
MPKNKLKPVIRYSQYEMGGHELKYPGSTKYLCIPLTPASRKLMVAAMVETIEYSVWDNPSYVKTAKYALAALEAMAKQP